MRKFLLVTAASILCVGAPASKSIAAASATTTKTPTIAQGSAEGDFDDDISKELLDSELGPSAEDAPPPAEYPYPGAKEEGISPEDAPKTAKAPQAPTEQPVQPVPQTPAEIERPKKINEDTGDYYYDTHLTTPTPVQRDAEHMPVDTKENGEYEYSQKLTPPEFSNRPGAEKPVEIKGNGEFKYATEESPTSATASFRFGFFGPPPPALKNESTDRETTFKDVYLKDQYPVLFFDYEFPLARKIGHLGIKLGSGIFVASGNGLFAKTDPARRSDDLPLEKYTFFMFPNQLTAQYRFQYSDTQLLVPYVEGGAGYFTFLEFRDSNASPRIGGALTTVAAGGLNILLDGLDRDAIRDLDSEYGINHIFLSLEARAIVGLNKSYDFSSTIFNAGFMMQF